MTLREFIINNRNEIDVKIKNVFPTLGALNDEERVLWIKNWKSFREWALSRGVRFE